MPALVFQDVFESIGCRKKTQIKRTGYVPRETWIFRTGSRLILRTERTWILPSGGGMNLAQLVSMDLAHTAGTCQMGENGSWAVGQGPAGGHCANFK